MTTQVSRPKNFSLHGYWIEHKLDDEGEVSMGVDVYQTVDPYADPYPIRSFTSEDKAVRWIEMGRG